MGKLVLVDTREQKPWAFKAPTKAAALKEGDYSVRGHSGRGGIVIERKALADLFGTMLRGRARFRRELDRIAARGYGVAAVLVEATYSEVCRGYHRTAANGFLVARMLLEDCLARGVWVCFCAGRQEAQELAAAMLLTYAGRAPAGAVVGEVGTSAAVMRARVRMRARTYKARSSPSTTTTPKKVILKKKA